MAAAKTGGVDGLLVTHLPDVRYLCGFTGSNAALVLAGGRACTVYRDGRYTAQAKTEARGLRVVIAKKNAAIAACEWMDTARVRRCGFDAGNTTVSALKAMQKSVAAKKRRGLFVPVGPLVAELRWAKDANEIGKMRKAAALGCRLFDGVLNEIVSGATEASVASPGWSIWRGSVGRRG